MKNFKKTKNGLSYRSPKLELYFSWLAVRKYLRCVKKFRPFDYFLMCCALPFLLAAIITIGIIFPLSLIFKFSCEDVTDPILGRIGDVAEFAMNTIRDLCVFFHCEGLMWRFFWSDSEFEDFEEKYPERARHVKLKSENFTKWFELQSYKMPITKDVYDWYQQHSDPNFIKEVKAKRNKRKKK